MSGIVWGPEEAKERFLVSGFSFLVSRQKAVLPGSKSPGFLMQDLNPGDGVNLIPSVSNVHNINAGDADAVAAFGRGDDVRVKVLASGSGRVFCGWMVANDLSDQASLRVCGIDQVQDAAIVWDEADVEIAILIAVYGNDLSFDRGASFDDM